MNKLVVDSWNDNTTSDTIANINAYGYESAYAFASDPELGTVTLRNSYNVSSVSDGGAGIWGINITSAFSSTDFTVTALNVDSWTADGATSVDRKSSRTTTFAEQYMRQVNTLNDPQGFSTTVIL
jgi:hypothetical protein